MDCVAYFTQSHIQTDKEIEMKVGCTLPQSGALASPENLVRVAKRAEELCPFGDGSLLEPLALSGSLQALRPLDTVGEFQVQ
jgi:hypothetical protein